MTKVLLATIYTHYSIIAMSNGYAINEVILLVDKEPNETMLKNIQLVDDTLGTIMKIKKVPTDLYNIVDIATKSVEIIDSIPEKDQLYIDITSGRKPKSLGLLFAAYARAKRITKFCYVTEDTNQIIKLPKMNYAINTTQKELLEIIAKDKDITALQIADKLNITKGIVYRYIKELIEFDALEKDGETMMLSDFGRILVL